MNAPKEITDYLEPIISIYLSDFRHKERSAFILCDNLIELSCKLRIKERNPADNRNRERKFPHAIKDAKLSKKFQEVLLKRHGIRNDMQHEKMGIAIDSQDCACDILNVVKVFKKLWGKYALDSASDWVICALRIVELYSNSSYMYKKSLLENKLLKETDWNFRPYHEEEEKKIMEEDEKKFVKDDGMTKRLPKKNEIIIEVGAKIYWSLLVREKTELVNQCLDEILL